MRESAQYLEQEHCAADYAFSAEDSVRGAK